MAEKQETADDIIAEMQKTKYGNEECQVKWCLTPYADRLEAALRREKAAIEADALSAGGLVEAMRQKEAICAKCRDGEPPKNCRFFGEPDGCSSPTYGHYPQLPIGNAAKLREAVKAVVDVGYPHNFQREAPHIRGYCYDITRAIEKCFAALAAPPRNCDVGTAEEQYARFVDMCHANVDLPGRRCRESCPFRRVPTEYKCDRAECFARWAQMPYVEKEGGAE